MKTEIIPIVGGDFNNTRVNEDRIRGNPNHKAKSNLELDKILHEFDLIDAYRAFHKGFAFTWRTKNSGIARRLDYFFIPRVWKQNVKKIKIVPTALSDHQILSMKVESKDIFPRGPGTFKCNNLLLDEEEYITLMKTCIHEQLENSKDIQDPKLKYELLKFAVAANTRKYSKQRAIRIRAREKRLAAELQQAINEFPEHFSDDNVAKLNQIEEEIAQLYQNRTKSSMFRGRVNWLNNGEKNTKFFFNLERSNYSKKTILSLQTENGPIKGQKSIQSEIEKHLKDLLSPNEPINPLECSEFLDSVSDKALSGEEYDNLDQPITLQEIEEALSKAPKGKSPGIDGLSIEWISRFWPEIKSLFMEALNASFKEGQLTQSQRRAIVTMIPKPNRDHELLKNYRGISLLCCDYKLIAAVMANRIKKVINNLISEDQTGFIKGRQITDNIRITKDLLEYTNQNSIPGYLVLTDASQAFDCLNFDYIDATLKAFNFPPNFCRYIRTMRENSEKCAINNGQTTRFQKVGKGCAQGCNLSPFIYILAQETLSASIRKDKEIKGITVNPENITFKGTSFADDNCYTISDKQSVQNLIEKIQRFGKCSGVKLNKEKTEARGMGSLRNNTEVIAGIKVYPRPVKLLGHWLSYNQDEEDQLNFYDKLDKINRTLSPWTARGLTLKGRVLVAKTLGISQVIYGMIAGTVPDLFLKKLDSLLSKFIWNQGTAKIARQVMIQDYQNGGMKHTPVFEQHLSLKTSWLKRICMNPCRKAYLFGTREFDKSGGIHRILESNFQTERLNGSFNRFYTQVLNCYQTASPLCCLPKGEEILSQKLLNHKYVHLRKKSFYNKNMHQCDSFLFWYDHATGQLKKYDQVIVNMRNPIDRQTFQLIRSAIPRRWIKEMRLLPAHQVPPPQDMINFADIKKEQILKLYRTPTAVNYWSNHIPSFNEFDFWELVAQNRMNKDPKVFCNNFRTLHNSIITRNRLFHFQLSDSKDCYNCPGTADSATHALLECKDTSQLIDGILGTLKIRDGTSIALTDAEKILGVIADTPWLRKLESILGLTRLFLVSYRYQQTGASTPKLAVLLVYIKHKLNIQHMALPENKRQQFLDLFGNFM